jgi:hypothetical protein
MPVERVGSIGEIAQEMRERAEAMVYCTLATIDASGWPRTRVVHPVWEGDLCWIDTRPTTPKVRQIEANPRVSLAWTSDLARPAYVEGVATLVHDTAELRRVWDLFIATPPPVGYDPTPMYGVPDDGRFGLILVEPRRVLLADPVGVGRLWVAEES